MRTTCYACALQLSPACRQLLHSLAATTLGIHLQDYRGLQVCRGQPEPTLLLLCVIQHTSSMRSILKSLACCSIEVLGDEEVAAGVLEAPIKDPAVHHVQQGAADVLQHAQHAGVHGRVPVLRKGLHSTHLQQGQHALCAWIKCASQDISAARHLASSSALGRRYSMLTAPITRR